MLVLTNEWLEELFCPQYGTSSWCHETKHDRVEHTVRWAPKEPWMQVAHVDPLVPNPSVSEFTRRSARRLTQKRLDGKDFWDRSVLGDRRGINFLGGAPDTRDYVLLGVTRCFFSLQSR